MAGTLQFRGWDSGIPRSRYILVAAAIFLSLSLIEILDIFDLPMEGRLASLLSPTSLSGFSLWAAGLGYVGLFVLMFLESASLPIPSEVILPFAGYLVYQGSMSLWAAVLVATLAGVGGALVDYYVALWIGRPAVVSLMGKMGLGEGRLVGAENWFNSKGGWSVFIARFIPGLRSIISFPAGFFEMDLKQFIMLTFAGALGWSAALVYIGYRAGPYWQSQLPLISNILSGLILYGAAALSAIYIMLYLTDRKD